ncbi:hypothetical protein DFH28DRAFT_1224168 [Melampsora americana]|nr:hypothetical protein DFH28DRAFT_1224168 [Melampsora americana]
MPPFSPSHPTLNDLLNPSEDMELSGSIPGKHSWAEQVEMAESMAGSMVEEITPTATPNPPGLATYWNALLKRKDVNGSLTLSENETRLISSLITNLINQASANETSITVAMLNSKLNGIQKTVNNLLNVQNRQPEVKSWAQVAKGNTMGQATTTLIDARPPPLQKDS